MGHEIRITRSAIMVSAETYNRYNWVVVVVPLTSHSAPEYDQVVASRTEGGLKSASLTLPDQLRAPDRWRLVKRLGHVSTDGYVSGASAARSCCWW